VLRAPLQASSSVQLVLVSAALYIKCTVDVSCLNTALLVTLCSVPFLLINIFINLKTFYVKKEKSPFHYHQF